MNYQLKDRLIIFQLIFLPINLKVLLLVPLIFNFDIQYDCILIRKIYL